MSCGGNYSARECTLKLYKFINAASSSECLMREQVRTRAVGSLAGQMFVVHEVMGIENPVTRDRFSWMLLFVPFACDWTSSSQICSCSHVIIE